MIWIGILFVFLLAADFSLLSKRDISFTLPVSDFSLSIFAYILAWTDLFPYFKDIINIMILLFSLCTAAFVWKSKDRKQRIKTLLSPASAGYLILFLIALRVSKADFCQWDEFSHWGTAVKDMFYSKRLGIFPESVSAYKTYPPGAALWELYFASYFKEWHDWPVIFAYNLLLIQWMMPIFGCLNHREKDRKGWLKLGMPCILTIIFVLIVYLIPYLYYSPFEGIAWRCIYIDRVLALGFAWMLFMHFGTAPEHKDRFYYLSFSLGACFQCLLKGTGVFFILMALMLIIPDILLTVGKGKRKVLIPYGIACILPFLVLLSWYTGLHIMNVSPMWDVNAISIRSIIKLVTGQEEPWRYETIRNYLTFLSRITLQFYHGSIILTVPAYHCFWAAAFALVSFLNAGRNRDLDKRNLFLALAVIFEFIIYEAAVLLTELYVLSQSEAVRISSGQRYSADFILGISCFIIFYIIRSLFSSSGSNRYSPFGFFLVLMFLCHSVSLEKAWLNITDHEQDVLDSYNYTQFSRYASVEVKLKNYLDGVDRCYILSDNDAYGHFVLRKQLIPARTNSEIFSSDAENQCEVFLKEILLNKYDHVFVDKVSDEFSGSCSGLFENGTITELSLYRVNYDETFELKLEATF